MNLEMKKKRMKMMEMNLAKRKKILIRKRSQPHQLNNRNLTHKLSRMARNKMDWKMKTRNQSKE